MKNKRFRVTFDNGCWLNHGFYAAGQISVQSGRLIAARVHVCKSLINNYFGYALVKQNRDVAVIASGFQGLVTQKEKSKPLKNNAELTSFKNYIIKSTVSSSCEKIVCLRICSLRPFMIDGLCRPKSERISLKIESIN